RSPPRTGTPTRTRSGGPAAAATPSPPTRRSASPAARCGLRPGTTIPAADPDVWPSIPGQKGGAFQPVRHSPGVVLAVQRPRPQAREVQAVHQLVDTAEAHLHADLPGKDPSGLGPAQRADAAVGFGGAGQDARLEGRLF